MNTVNTVNTYRYSLDTTSKKVVCPQCRQKRFVLFKDNETKEYLADHVGRCDREGSCGYSYGPKEYFAEAGIPNKPLISESAKKTEIVKVDFLPMEYLNWSVNPNNYSRNNFYSFLLSLFGERVTLDLCKKYLIGTAGYWKGAVAFPQIDEAGNLRQIKIMLHDPLTGKRIKEGAEVDKWNKDSKEYVTEIIDKSCSLVYGRFINESTKKLNLEQTFFGCHLLTEFPDKPVCIVESEKTAIIASVYLPQFVWLATGGASGCKWREYAIYKVLKGRSITFFPDHGLFNKKTEKTCFQEWQERCERIREAMPRTKVKVSDVLEKRLTNEGRQDQDLADLLLVRDPQTGHALTTAGYPVLFDYRLTA